jgi:hypothetical protein
MRCLLLFLAAIAGVTAQTPPTPANAQLASLSGAVANSVTGAPVLRAHVSITLNSPGTAQQYGAITNGEGQFAITQLPPGHYTVSVERAGFVMQRNPAGASFSEVKLSPGDKKENFKLTLVPTGAINGRVFDAAGEPMQGVSVSAESGGNESATTDDKGQFRIGGLQPGKYRIKAAPQTMPLPPETRTDGTAEVNYSPTYYPDSLAEKQAARVEVQPAGELTGIDIHLVRTPIVSVSGRVSGLPTAARNVSIDVQRHSSMGENSQSGSIVKPDGTFTIWRLDPGKYTLVAAIWGQGGQNRLQSAPVEIEVAGVNLEHIDMRMIPPFDIPIQIHFEDDQARQVPQPPAQPGQQPPPAPIRRVSLEPLIGAQMPAPTADIEAGDSATLERVQPGLYHLAISWRPAYVKSIRVGSVETEGETLDVRSGPVGPVTVLVSSNVCEVSGTVSDSQAPAPGVRVALVRSMENGRPDFHMITSAADGAYKFGGVPPGKYKLLVAEDNALSVILRGQDMDDDADAGESLELHAGDRVIKNLQQHK